MAILLTLLAHPFLSASPLLLASVPLERLSDRIRHARSHAGLSQAKLADLVGVQRSAVAQWERRDGSRPSTGNLARVAHATHANFEWLATGRGRKFHKADSHDAQAEVSALKLDHYAHDEVEERLLMAVRRLDYQDAVAVTELAESLARARTSR